MEDYPKGYPRFSALLAAHESFHLLRRFSNARMRLLLLGQDRVTQLEQRLDEIDKSETSPIFLASSRRDRNEERRKVLDELKIALESYGLSQSSTTKGESRMLSSGQRSINRKTTPNFLASSRSFSRHQKRSELEQDECLHKSRRDGVPKSR